MPAKRRGLYEVRTRVTVHLPVNDAQQEKAFFRVISYLRELNNEGIGVSGYTHSSLRPAAFHGWWWSEDESQWWPDDIVLLLVDYHLDFNDPQLSARVKDLKQTIRRWYRYHRSPQEEVWVVAYPVARAGKTQKVRILLSARAAPDYDQL